MQDIPLQWQNSADLEKIIFLLKDGKVVAGTSDTVPGLLANNTKSGYEALNAIKKRHEKPYIMLIESADRLKNFVENPSIQIEKIVQHFWPGPLTIVFKAKRSLPSHLVNMNGTISLRVPDHAGLKKILSAFDGLFSTSANLTGQPVPLSIADLDPSIRSQVAAIVASGFEDRTQSSRQMRPSTIIDCSQETIRLLREGAISKAALEEVLGTPIN